VDTWDIRRKILSTSNQPIWLEDKQISNETYSHKSNYVSSKCIGGRHTECVTGPGTGGQECTCDCHILSGEARHVLTMMCEDVGFRRIMIGLVHKQTMREEKLQSS
jgi:hypothetical protein